MNIHEQIEKMPFMDEFIDCSKSWQSNYIKLQDAWIECLEKVSEAYKSGGDSEQQAKKVMKACMEFCEGFMSLWRQFAQDQTKALFRFSNSLRKQKEQEEKNIDLIVKDEREITKKPAKKVKEGKSA